MSVDTFDWSLCIFCQKVSNDDTLQNPSTGKRSNSGDGYSTMTANIQRFESMNCLPMPINSILIGEINDIIELMKSHKAKWHKRCSNKFNNLQVKRAEARFSKQSGDDSPGPSSSKITRLSCGGATNTNQDKCFFCDKSSGELHKISMLKVDRNVRKCALDLQDTILLAKLSAGDLVSQDAVYHKLCLVSLYNRARSLQSGESDLVDSRKQLHGIALAELIAYIEEAREDPNRVPVFKMAQLSKLYQNRLKQLDSSFTDRVHSTHLKNRILSNFPDMRSHHDDGCNVLLAFEEDIGNTLKSVSKNDYDGDALVLKQAAEIIRRDIFNSKCGFDGQFSTTCQQDAVPPQLLSLVNMILRGTNIEQQNNSPSETQVSLSIAQLLKFNAAQRHKELTGVYHSTSREPPLPVYLGLLLHGETRKKGLINKLFDLGLSINYNRVLAISTEMGNKVCARYREESVVCPPKLRRGVFTTSAVDNIDHNPSSSTAQGSFHGTGISLFQHPSVENEGEARDQDISSTPTGYGKSLSALPESYTVVPPVAVQRKDTVVPDTDTQHLRSQCDTFTEEVKVENRWLEHVDNEIRAESSSDMRTSWSAFHCSIDRQRRPLDTSALLPLFPEEAKSTAMIRHSIDLVTKTIQFLNPGQVPVITCDQPLYAVAKQIQWYFTNTHGENRLVVVLGGLHIEMAALKAVGNWLEGSGWTNALVEANVASMGKADSFLKASHTSRTRHAHQVTACALYILMRRAYAHYIQSLEEDANPLMFEDWKSQRIAEAPQFHYWSITLDFELTILLFVRSLREGNFNLYRDALTKLAPWFFALDHTNYARWLPVHIRDMMALGEKHPTVSEAFHQGKFVVRKTYHDFSSIPIDQAHEQNNKCVKGDGGAVGLTENPMQLLRWMISGPEETRVISEFESSVELLKGKQDDSPDYRHHEQVNNVQVTFRNQVRALCDVIEEMGNPFLETSEDVLVLDTRDIVHSTVTDTIRHIEDAGKRQYDEFTDVRLKARTKPLSDPIKQNRYPLFGNQPARSVTKEKQQITSLKQNCALFSKLYISCQVRNGNLDEFFRHENQSCPPSLSSQGKLRHGTKSDLLACLEVEICAIDCPQVDAILLDGAALVNMWKPGTARRFHDYWEQVFQPHIRRMLETVQRLDIIWDVYLPNSLKSTERIQRGKGVRRRVKPDTVIPGNWQSFLRNDENKTELFQYLAGMSVTVDCEEDKLVLSTTGNRVLSNDPGQCLDRISPCEHEEADTRLLLHALDVANQGLTRVMIRTVDTDVVVLAIALYRQLKLDELWIGFGTGKNFRYIPAHSIAVQIGPSKAEALPVFHAITGCDQTSAFATKGKRTAWETWKVYPEVTEAFNTLRHMPTEEMINAAMPSVEQYIVFMYDKANTYSTVDEARRDLFTRKGRAIESIPPTSAALLQHVKRAAYQAGYCWGQALVAIPDLPDPSTWGWQRGLDQTWEPLWTILPQASETCLEFLKCGCNVEKGCRGRCKCVAANVLCTALCKCGGSCDR